MVQVKKQSAWRKTATLVAGLAEFINLMIIAGNHVMDATAVARDMRAKWFNVIVAVALAMLIK